MYVFHVLNEIRCNPLVDPIGEIEEAATAILITALQRVVSIVPMLAEEQEEVAAIEVEEEDVVTEMVDLGKCLDLFTQK